MAVFRVMFSVSIDGYGAGRPLGVGGRPCIEWTVHTPRSTMAKAALMTTSPRAGFAGSAPGSWAATFGPGAVHGPIRVGAAGGARSPRPRARLCPQHHPRPRCNGRRNGISLCYRWHRGRLGASRSAAGEKDVRLGGGAHDSAVSQGLVHEMHLAVAPILLGRGEALLTDLDLPTLGYRCATPAKAAHYVITRVDSRQVAHGGIFVCCSDWCAKGRPRIAIRMILELLRERGAIERGR